MNARRVPRQSFVIARAKKIYTIFAHRFCIYIVIAVYIIYIYISLHKSMCSTVQKPFDSNMNPVTPSSYISVKMQINKKKKKDTLWYSHMGTQLTYTYLEYRQKGINCCFFVCATSQKCDRRKEETPEHQVNSVKLAGILAWLSFGNLLFPLWKCQKKQNKTKIDKIKTIQNLWNKTHGYINIFAIFPSRSCSHRKQKYTHTHVDISTPRMENSYTIHTHTYSQPHINIYVRIRR